MKKFFLLLFSFVAFSITAQADGVTEQEALQKAQQFLKGKVFKQRNLRRAPQRDVTTIAPYYVFNVEANGGFVIVSGDDRTVPILGYADEGTIDMDNLPDNMKSWLDGYAEVISSLQNTGGMMQVTNPSWPAVEPLIGCYWGQSSPYNLQCPEYDGTYSVTGCVATAMAQLMYYHRWPETTTMEIPSYTSDYYSRKGKRYTSTLSALPITTFKWDKMKPIYESDETGDAADAVSELMRYCGQAVEMKYTPDVSGANVYAYHLIRYFGYSAKATDIKRSDYYSSEWEQMIYNELANNRPVLYGGSSTSGGHQFICDGYDGNGLFHINWGWEGLSDGYFVLSVLNPNARGIGGGIAEDGYTRGQHAIIGIEPGVVGESITPTVYINNISYTNSQYSRNSVTEDFNGIGLSSSIYITDNNGSISHAWALYRDGECLGILGQSEIMMNIEDSSSPSGDVCFGSGLSDGEYELYDVYGAVGTDAWHKVIGAGTNYIIANIAGNTLTLRKSSDSEGELLVNSVNLTGDYRTGRPMSATMNLTNQTYTHEQTFFLWENGTNIAKLSTYIDYGQTQEGVFYFVPKKSGSVIYKITSDSSGSNVLWSETVTIEQTAAQSLSGSISIDGIKNGAIAGTTIKATVTLENTGNSTFNDNVYFIVYPRDDINAVTEQVKKVEIAKGGSIDVQVEFTQLEAGHSYWFDVRYYNQTELDYAAFTLCRVGYVFVPVRLNANIEVTNGTSDKKIYGTTLKTDVTLTNNGTNTYNDLIAVFLVNKVNSTLYHRTFQENTIQLAAGETITLPFEFTNLETGSEYLIYTYYYPENKQTLCGSSSVYTAVEDENITFGDAHAKALCIANWDGNNDGEFSVGEAALVTDLGEVFKNNTEVASFNELKFFTGLKSVGSSAFSGCSSLTSVVIPSCITSIGSSAFYGCDNLTSVTVELLNPLSIDGECFTNRTNATLYVPINGKGAYEAADYWKEFKNMVGIDSNISFANSQVKALCIANWDSNGDGELSMSEAAAVTDIGTVFKNNSSIASFNELQYFTGLTSIGSQAFYYCTNLSSIIIPNNVTSIGDWAFYKCNSLPSIKIPRSVTSITGNIVQSCINLSSIIVDEDNSHFDSRDNCNAIISTSNNTLICGCMSTIIPNTVTAIGDAAFNGCSKLNYINIPSSVTTIGSSVFNLCNGLDYITVEGGNTVFDSRDDCNAIIRTSGNKLIAGSNNTVIPDGVKFIGEYAFSSRTGLTSIVIPSSMRYIENGAFSNCTNLTTITIPYGVTSVSNYSFQGCSNLTSAIIPSTVETMGYNVFYGCNLVDVKVERLTPLNINTSVFPNRSNATLYVPVGGKTAYQAASPWNGFKQIVEIGDANGDGKVSIADVTAIINCINGDSADTFIEMAADVNSDNKISIADVTGIINIINQ